MRGLISVVDVIASLPKDRQAAIEARGAELLAKVDKRMTLAELRKGRKLSQAKMAEALGIGQMQISRLEQRKDPRLSDGWSSDHDCHVPGPGAGHSRHVTTCRQEERSKMEGIGNVEDGCSYSGQSPRPSIVRAL